MRDDNYWSIFTIGYSEEGDVNDCGNGIIEEADAIVSNISQDRKHDILNLPGKFCSWQQRRDRCRTHTIKCYLEVELTVSEKICDSKYNVNMSSVTRIMDDRTRDSLVYGGESQQPSRAMKQEGVEVMSGLRRGMSLCEGCLEESRGQCRDDSTG